MHALAAPNGNDFRLKRLLSISTSNRTRLAVALTPKSPHSNKASDLEVRRQCEAKSTREDKKRLGTKKEKSGCLLRAVSFQLCVFPTSECSYFAICHAKK